MVKNNEDRLIIANDELIEKGNLAAIEELFLTDYIVHSGGKNYKGHKFIRRWIKQLRTAIPDINVVKIEILNQAKDTITWQRTLKGTHKNKIMGIQATGQKVKWIEQVVSRFEDKKIAEEWVVSELAGYLLSKPPIK